MIAIFNKFRDPEIKIEIAAEIKITRN